MIKIFGWRFLKFLKGLQPRNVQLSVCRGPGQLIMQVATLNIDILLILSTYKLINIKNLSDSIGIIPRTGTESVVLQ